MSFNAFIILAALFGITSQGWGTTLNLPSGAGGTPNATSWGTSGAVGTAAGNAIATASGGGTAATFSVASSVYTLNTTAYFDINALSASSFTIGSTDQAIDLNGNNFTVNETSGKTVTFGAKLSNGILSTSPHSGGLTVQGGGSVLFDNTNGQYTSGMDLGALYIDGSTVTLPASSTFGAVLNNGSGTSYSSISLNTTSTLVLSNSTSIGSRSSGISVPISFDTSSPTIQLASGATANITPKFNTGVHLDGTFSDDGAGNMVPNTMPDILNINTNGGTLNMYGNIGTGVTLKVNDTTGNGTLNLYGAKTYSGVSAGGGDYVGSNLNIYSGTVNLYLDPDGQSLLGITMMGGTVTGSAYLGLDATLSGASKMVATRITMNNLNMSGSSRVSGRILISGDLNLNDSAVFAPSITTDTSNPTAVVYGNMNISGTPHYVVSYDGTNSSLIQVSSNLDASNLQVDLLLAAGTYSSGNTYTKTILTSAGLTAPTADPTWNIDGVFIDPAKTIPATGDEVDLSLTSDGSNLTLALTIHKTLYVNTPVTTHYVAPPSTTSAPSTLIDTAAIINATFSNASSSSDAMMQGTSDGFRFTNTSANPLLPRVSQPNNNASLLENIIRASETSGPVSFSRNETRLWITPYTSRSRVNNAGTSIGQQGWSGGSLVGFEKRDRKNIWTVGALSGLTLSRFHNNGDPDTHSKAKGYVVGAYNTLKYTDNKDAGNFGHEVLISRITNLNDMQRRGEQNKVTYFAKAANKSVTNLGNAQLNYIFNLQKAVTCRFSLGGTYTDENEGAYTETNAGTLGNRVSGKNTKAGEIYFGPGLRHIWKDGPRTYRLTGVYEYGVNVYNKGTTQTTTTLAATPQVLTNAPSAGENKHYFQLNGSYLNRETGLKFSGAYSGTFYKDTQNHTFTLKVEKRF